ncbi:MAG: glycosyltransferase family 2 protein [Acidimicrobiales bacterium]
MTEFVPPALRKGVTPPKAYDHAMPVLDSGSAVPRPSAPGQPALSLVVVVYDMPDQAERTIQSLSIPYQQGVVASDYEILVVENESPHMLGADRAERAGPNVRYFAHHDPVPTPVGAANFGGQQARGDMIGLLIDGARMVTPGVVANILAARRIGPDVVVAVPGYHIGSQRQQDAAQEGYDEAAEAELLAGINWPNAGYRLFDIAVFSGTSRSGYFRPVHESNCLCLPRHLWTELGGLSPDFVSPGGGHVNLDFYRRAVDHPRAVPVILFGEGTFHQFHGGVTTGGTDGDERQAIIDGAFDEYERIRGEGFRQPTKRAVLFGAVSDEAAPFLKHAAELMIHRPERD